MMVYGFMLWCLVYLCIEGSCVLGSSRCWLMCLVKCCVSCWVSGVDEVWESGFDVLVFMLI